MSGICGLFGLDRQPVELDDFTKMFSRMRHRGSDREGTWHERPIALGHKALWSTPEAALEQQPLLSRDGRWAIAADARIDNRQQLLELLDHPAPSPHQVTDVDLILLAWQRWGEAAPEQLLGDFACAVYDRTGHILYLARDAMGARPLYWVRTDRFFAFASELSPLFELSGVEKRIDENMEEKYLRCRGLDVHETLFQDIYRLSAATCTRIRGQEMRQRRYWFPEQIPENRSLSFQAAADRFRQIFTEAVQCRLRSPGPVGCELSGGLDSSSVFCTAASLPDGPSLIPIAEHFGDMTCDESGYSTLVANHTGHALETVRVDRLDFAENHSLTTYYRRFRDWPHDGFFIGLLPVARQLRPLDVRVLLTGQGGDHVTRGSGYVMADYLRQLRLIQLAREMQPWPWTFREFERCVLRPNMPELLVRLGRRIKHGRWSPLGDLSQRVDRSKRGHAFDEELEIMTGTLNAFLMDTGAYHELGAYSIEARHPFFDRRLVEFSLSLPPHYKLGAGMTKQILRRALARTVPAEILERRDKAGFTPVLEKQLAAATGAVTDKNLATGPQSDYYIQENIPEQFRSYSYRKWHEVQQ